LDFGVLGSKECYKSPHKVDYAHIGDYDSDGDEDTVCYMIPRTPS